MKPFGLFSDFPEQKKIRSFSQFPNSDFAGIEIKAENIKGASFIIKEEKQRKYES